jgi:hypothetical protein
LQAGVYVNVGNRIVNGVPKVNVVAVTIGVARAILVTAHELIVTVNGTEIGVIIG